MSAIVLLQVVVVVIARDDGLKITCVGADPGALS